MIFAQHPSDSFVDAARSAAGVLLLGHLGQGVGLLGDLLAAAAAEVGLPASSDELHSAELKSGAVLKSGMLKGRGLTSGADLCRLSAAAVWLGTSRVPQSPGAFDVVVALDQAASSIAYRFVKPSGRILFAAAEKTPPIANRFYALVSPRMIHPQSNQSSIGYLAGCLSGCVSLPECAWRTALDAHLRPRDRRSARAEFAIGRRETVALGRLDFERGIR